MKLSTEPVDSDSGHSPSDDEKKAGVGQGDSEALEDGGLPPDPDAHLSPEERAAIVRSIFADPFHPMSNYVTNRSHIGPQTPVETGPPLDTMALPPISDIVPRSHQYRKRQARWS